MKKRNNAFARLVGLLLVSATVLTLTVAATGGAGTSSDPLVTLSYLNEKFLPQILSEVDKKTASREQTLSSKLTEQVKSETQAFEQKYGASSGNASGGTAASFTVVTLNQGQILYMGVGCEAMLRTGSGVCVAASTPGLMTRRRARRLQAASVCRRITFTWRRSTAAACRRARTAQSCSYAAITACSKIPT